MNRSDQDSRTYAGKPPSDPQPEPPRPADEHPYSVGISQANGGYADTAGRSKGADSGAYQGVRPWGPQDGMQEDQDFRGRGPKGYSPSDDGLKETLCERLFDDPNIDASEITVEVTDGRVTLSGEVDSPQTKQLVEDLVDHCRGVKEIDNQLRIVAARRDTD